MLYLQYKVPQLTVHVRAKRRSKEETWHHPYGEAWGLKYHAVGMFFSGRDWETSQDWAKDEQSKVQRDPWSKPATEHSGPQTGAKVLPSNRTTTWSTQPRQRKSGFGTRLWMSLSGPARARTWTQFKIAVQRHSPSTLTEIERICWEEWEKLPKCQACRVIPKRNRGCNRCQRCFNKLLSKGSEYLLYVNVIFPVLCICKFAKITKKPILLCHYWVLCLD